jgi:hypothetical protein
MFSARLSKITLDYSANADLPRHFPNLLRQSKNSDYLAVTISKRNATLFIEGKGMYTRQSKNTCPVFGPAQPHRTTTRKAKTQAKAKNFYNKKSLSGKNAKEGLFSFVNICWFC